MVFCALGISSAFAQKTFSGKVIGPDGMGLPGVSVVEKANQTNGVSTDIDGKWTLTVPNGDAILEFSSIGMKTITIAAKNAASVTMKDDAQLLGEVVVTGMLAQTKESLTGSVVEVKEEELTKSPSSNVVKGLTGKVAGVQIYSGSGRPGELLKFVLEVSVLLLDLQILYMLLMEFLF